ncbi:hypothetical protein [Rufibacter soli]
MRAQVLKRFHDKVKGTTHDPKDQATNVVTLTAERLKELTAKGYVAALPEETVDQKEDKPGAKRATKEEKAPRKTK